MRCIDDEIPYDIPSTWMWCRFGDIVKTITGNTPERGIQKYWSNGIVSTTKERISQVAANECFSNISKKGSLIMSFKLTVGRTSILGIDAYHNEAIITILPFPPLDEQQRIIKRVQELFGLLFG